MQYKQTSSGTWLAYNDGAPSATGRIVTGLTNGTSYDFRVLAVNVAGDGNWTTMVSAGTFSLPGMPTGLGIDRQWDQQIDLSWAAPGNTGGTPIIDYVVEYCAGTQAYRTHPSGTWDLGPRAARRPPRPA